MDFNFEEDEAPSQEARSGPKKRFRKNKLKLVFDTEERKQFLMGFRKRKQERKEKYIEKLERDLAKEKKRIKQQTERATKKLSNSHSVLPEVKNILEEMPEKEETYDLGNTLVSITSLDDQIYRNVPTIKEDDDSDYEDSKSLQRSKRTKVKLIKSLGNFGSDSEDDDDELKKAQSDPFFNPINDDELTNSDASSEDERNIPYNPLEMLRKNTESSAEPQDSKGMTKAKLEKEANRMLQQSEAFKKIQKLKQKKSKKFRMFRLQPTEEGGADTKGSASKKKGGGKELKKGSNNNKLRRHKKGKRK